MSEWMAVAVVSIICAYKLIDRWIDSRESENEHHNVYSTHEREEQSMGFMPDDD